MKRIIFISLGTLLAGLLLGWLIFGGGESASSDGHSHAVATSSGGEQTVYTCSMHPQIRQPEPGDCPICGMDLIPADQQSNSDDPARLVMTTSAVALAGVRTTTVGSGGDAGGSPQRYLNGRVTVNQRRQATQPAHVAGRIEALFVNSTGQAVRRGQRLATLYSPELVAAQKELLEAQQVSASLPELLAAAREKLRQYRLTEAQIDAILEVGEVQRTLPVYATQSGVVLELMAAEGDYVQAGQPLMRLADLGSVWVEFDAYEADLAQLSRGDTVRFRLAGRDYAERITYIDPVMDAQTRVARVRVELPNRGGRLKPQMFVRGMVQGDRAEGQAGGLRVPRSAVLWTGKRSLVYVAVPNASQPTYEARQVVLGERVGEAYLIESGLQAGEEVVTYGTFMVDAAAQLNDKYSMMNQVEIEVEGQPAPEPIHPLEEEVPSFAETPAAFREQLAAVEQAYLPLKNALVESDVAAAQQAVPGLKEALGQMPAAQLDGEAAERWAVLSHELSGALTHIGQHDDLGQVREGFQTFSHQLILAERMYGPLPGQRYVQFCPMADDDRGAFWLSHEEPIRNPYFGDKMLTCGWVEQVWGK